MTCASGLDRFILSQPTANCEPIPKLTRASERLQSGIMGSPAGKFLLGIGYFLCLGRPGA